MSGKFAHFSDAKHFDMHFFGAFWWWRNLESKPDAKPGVRIDNRPVSKVCDFGYGNESASEGAFSRSSLVPLVVKSRPLDPPTPQRPNDRENPCD